MTMHPEKSKVVYCRDSNRTEQHPHLSFTFLVFTFRPRKAHSKQDQLFTSFLPGASDDALRRMRQAVRRWRLNRQTHVTLADVARLYNPVIQGWWQYYGAFYKIAMRPGKPLMAGRLGQAAMLGLPGNPVSAIVCGHLFLLPAIRRLLGLTDVAPKPLRAVLAEDVGPTGPRTHYMRARLIPGDGLPQIAPFARQDSALLGVLAEAGALLIRPMGDGPRRAGDEVGYLPL